MLGTQSALQKVYQIIWKEIEILCAEYELSTEELQAVSGGLGWYDRDWFKEGCVATCE